MSNNTRPPLRWLLLLAIIIGIAFCAFAVLVLRRDGGVDQAVRQLRPGMSQAEVRALLKPLRADMMKKEQNQKEGYYFLRGTDEFIIVVMEKDGEDFRVREVKHLPDLGPWWERLRRNWEGRFRHFF